MDGNVTMLRPTTPVRNAPEPDFLALRIDHYYRERVQNTWNGGHIMRGRLPGTDALHLSSNDYLGIARHPDILNAMANSVLSQGNGMLMSALYLHGECPQLRLEARLAQFMRAESGVLCQSGYAANVGLIQAVADGNSVVYADMMCHMSVLEGIRSAGTKVVPIHHNDVEHLERQILRHGPGIVVVESVYSTNGQLCPLREITDICEAQNCVLIVDESHSLGTHGPHGEGIVVAMGLENRVHFRTASLAKAFAGRAGFITCSKRFTDYLKATSNPAIFSSTLLPHDIAGLDATLTVIQRENWRREKLQTNSAYLRECLDGLGYNLNDSQSQIVSLESGSEQQTIVLRDALEARGIFGSIFCAPATPKNRALIRFSVNANLTEAELKRIVEVCRDIRDEVDLANWPSTRRKMRGKVRSADMPVVVQPLPALEIAA